jgi:hypothetical protein
MLNDNTRWKGGQSPHKFTYTYGDIAELLGLTLQTVWTYAKAGKFDPYSMESIFDYKRVRDIIKNNKLK